jgi:hypothetical protein
MKTRSLMGIGIMLAAMTAGCALGDRKIALLYKPVTKVAAGEPKNIAIVKFKDLRKNPDVGEVRNGYGMKTARVIAEGQDVGAWVANALADELTAAGCKITKYNDIAPPDSQISITGNVLEAYTKMYMSSTCTIRATINVSKANVPVLSKEYYGKHGVLALLADTGEYENAMQGALQDMMKKCVPEILEAIK